MTRFANHVVWITGASSGIGAALARAWAAQGAHLIVSARRAPELEALVAQLGLGPDRALVLPLDLEQPHTHAAAVAAALAHWGGIDVMVHNAGVSQRSPLADTQLAVLRRLMEVNYFGTVSLTQLLLPHLLARGRGQLVVISSVMGLYSAPLRGGYAAAKHALHGYFEALRAETHDRGLRVTLVCPGYVRTDVSRNALTADGTPQGSMDATTAAGLDPDAVARRIVAAVAAGRLRLVMGGWRELMGHWLSRLAPGLHALAIRKIRST